MRQQSGFSVTEETSGGECKIKRSARWDPEESHSTLLFREPEVDVPSLFGEHNGIACFAGYVSVPKETNINLSITVTVDGDTYRGNESFTAEADEWTPVGIHATVQLCNIEEHIADLEAELTLEGDTLPEWLDVFGINLSSIVWEDFINNIEYDDGATIGDKFDQRTTLTVPYLYYLNHERAFLSSPVNLESETFVHGQHVFLKSCNRCGRFLPTEYVQQKERNLTSFGNHCVSRAPCNHSTFGYQTVIEEDSELEGIPPALEGVVNREGGGLVVNLYYGYQLECKACKKFYVNAALNPMRNSTQHREDALRRRAIEVLVRKLLDDDWIYHRFRQERDEEFDEFIWERFNKECFKCGKDLPSPSEMDLDHTMPLAALWPLDKHATCLCSDCNSKKSDQFPVDFYTPDELRALSEITGQDLEMLSKRSINREAVRTLQRRIIWFFDEFLSADNYQKDRDGKIVADLIIRAIQDRIDEANMEYNLVAEYQQQAGRMPETITSG
jgi:5-methylcytosine-specific restriction endonuclease McrA